jgi:hypothetical protein
MAGRSQAAIRRRIKVDTLATLALEHLLLRLRPLHRALVRAVRRQSALAAQLVRPDLAALCVTDDQVTKLLAEVDRRLINTQASSGAAELSSAEQTQEDQLRQRARALGTELPLDHLSRSLRLTPFEEETLVICAAPEIDRAYERIYAYVLDDLNRRLPCVDLLCSLTSGSLSEELCRRFALGPFGNLRRTGLLQPQGEAGTGARQELRLASGLLEFLTGSIEMVAGLFVDRAEVDVPIDPNPPFGVSQSTIAQLARLIRQEKINIVGIWGPRDAGHEECVLALAASTAMPLRRLLPSELERSGNNLVQSLREMLRTASVLKTIIWVNTEFFDQPEHERWRDALTDEISTAGAPVVLTGVHSWRPTQLLLKCDYAEIELSAQTYDARRMQWLQSLPEIDSVQANDLAARFRLSGSEVRAVARVARTRACVQGNGAPAPVGDQVDAACATVTRKRSAYFATLIKPRRGPADLVLSPELHRQVIEVAKFVRAGPLVDEKWGFGHLWSGSSGVKALITGESGTGKTLAAEVIAGELGLPMLKVDLSQIVSKWVGESERNLEMVFREAEESHSVLVFDECESLFGRRGEIQSGTDRYSNLEVGYLLQRLESFYGLAILTSNLKDQIDSAFTRRFQIILHFPLPGRDERRRIWRIAFPETAPLDVDIDLDLLQSLDLSGAGIVGAARTAALLAADERSDYISMLHVVKAVSRQYKREARVLSAGQLGPYASLLRLAELETR